MVNEKVMKKKSIFKIIINIAWIASLITLVILGIICLVYELLNPPFFEKIMENLNITWSLYYFYIIFIINLICLIILSVLRDKFSK